MPCKPRPARLSAVSHFGRSKSIYEYSIENLINSAFAVSKANKNKAVASDTHPPRLPARKEKAKKPKPTPCFSKKAL
jgi:hypothetical protein